MGKPQNESPLLKRLLAAAETNSEKAKLCSTQLLTRFINDELRAILKSLYKQKDPRLKVTATVFNAIFKEAKAVFLLSKSSMGKLLASDKNHGRNAVGSDYGNFHAYLISNNIIKKISDGSAHKAMSVYELTDPELVRLFEQIFGSEIISEQREKCLKVLDTYIKSDKNKLPKKPSLDSGSGVDLDNESESGSEVENFKQRPDLISKDLGATTQPTPSLESSLTFDSFKSLDPKKQLYLVACLDSLTDSAQSFITDLTSRLSQYGSFRPKQIEQLFKIYSENANFNHCDSSANIVDHEEIKLTDEERLYMAEIKKKAKEKRIIQNAGQSHNHSDLSPEIIEERRRAKEIADEIFKRK